MLKFLRIETSKLQREWIFYLLALVFLSLGITNGVHNYVSNVDIFEETGVTWIAVWSQGALVWSAVFLPFTIALYCGMLSTIDNTNNNWQRLLSYNAAYRTYYAKLAKAAIFTAFTQTALLIATLTSGWLLHFDLNANTTLSLTSWALLGFLGALAICSLQLWLGLYIRSYAILVGIGTIGAFVGLAITVALPQLNMFFPYSQIIQGNHVRELAPFSTAQLVIFLASNTLYIIFPSILAIARFKNYNQ